MLWGGSSTSQHLKLLGKGPKIEKRKSTVFDHTQLNWSLKSFFKSWFEFGQPPPPPHWSKTILLRFLILGPFPYVVYHCCERSWAIFGGNCLIQFNLKPAHGWCLVILMMAAGGGLMIFISVAATNWFFSTTSFWLAKLVPKKLPALVILGCWPN